MTSYAQKVMPMNKIIKHAIYVFLAAVLAATFLSINSNAQDIIVRPYQSVRSAGMGGLLITTGLYEENFYGNPARVTRNPKWRVALPGVMVETTATTIENLSSLGGSSIYSSLSEKSGENMHARVQMVFPAVYIPQKKDSWAFALISSAQTDINPSRYYKLDPSVIIDTGPAFTYGRKLMKNKLSVGANLHVAYRTTSDARYSLVDLIQGQSISPTDGGEGLNIDIDLGGTYRLGWKPWNMRVEVAASFNNLFGGTYSIDMPLVGSTGTIVEQPRTMNFGLLFNQRDFWKFSDWIMAVEILDIGNNSEGSVFKWVHLGTEVKFGVWAIRFGNSMGYWSLGTGVDYKFFTIDFAFYGEELNLTPGDKHDRRLTAQLSFYI